MSALKKTYDRIAPIYDLLDGPYEKMWKGRLRAAVFSGLSGEILDAGAGTGCNIAAYPVGARMTAVDASEPMLVKARQRAARLGRAVDFRRQNLASMDFADESFDAVVATFVFMCIPEEAQLDALREVARVCRRGGRIRLVDYCMSEKPTVRAGMRVMSPWLKFMFHGTYDASTEKYFAAAGLAPTEQRLLMGDVVKMTVLRRS
ncbi:MAG TPA: class I SAM-dependent methyltransferase [Rhodoblastus sp.]|nr:class I SAM-dependent methyltransferase [Rhodoblastus sp.]